MSRSSPGPCLFWQGRGQPIICSGFHAVLVAIEQQRTLLKKQISNIREVERTLERWTATKAEEYMQERLSGKKRLAEDGLCRDAFQNLARKDTGRYISIPLCDDWRQEEQCSPKVTEAINQLVQIVVTKIPGVDAQPPGIMDEMKIIFPEYVSSVPSR